MFQKLHKKNSKTISDINEHLEKLKELSSECNHVTEFGVRQGVSTISLLAGQKKGGALISFDIEKTSEIDEIGQMVKSDKKNWTFIKFDTRKVTIDPTDMLFIDTLHNYRNLKQELWNSHSLVRKYIVLHDTESFRFKGETPGQAGLWYAVEEFLYNHPERELSEHYQNNNGLTVLERVDDVCLREKNFEPIVCIRTAIYDNQDILRLQPQQTIDCDYICYTDNPDLECEPGARDQRKIVVDTSRQHLHPRMQAKYRRMHPEEASGGEYLYHMWVDGTTIFKRQDTVEYLLSQFLEKSDIICYKHDNRDCIYDEANYSGQFKKYRNQPMQAQVAHYRKQGMPEHYGLTGTGLLLTRGRRWDLEGFFNRRWTECLTRSYQDQLSFDYVVWKHGIKRQRFKESQFIKNPYVLFTGKHKHDR